MYLSQPRASQRGAPLPPPTSQRKCLNSVNITVALPCPKLNLIQTQSPVSIFTETLSTRYVPRQGARYCVKNPLYLKGPLTITMGLCIHELIVLSIRP